MSLESLPETIRGLDSGAMPRDNVSDRNNVAYPGRRYLPKGLSSPITKLLDLGRFSFAAEDGEVECNVGGLISCG